MKVAVAGIQMEVFEGFAGCGVVVEEVLMFEGVLGVVLEEIFGKTFEMAVAAGAFAGLEVVAFGQIETSTGSAFLEIVAAGIVLSDDALQSGVDPVPIIDGMATILVPGLLE